jgi:hypothetical protein
MRLSSIILRTVLAALLCVSPASGLLADLIFAGKVYNFYMTVPGNEKTPNGNTAPGATTDIYLNRRVPPSPTTIQMSYGALDGIFGRVSNCCVPSTDCTISVTGPGSGAFIATSTAGSQTINAGGGYTFSTSGTYAVTLLYECLVVGANNSAGLDVQDGKVTWYVTVHPDKICQSLGTPCCPGFASCCVLPLCSAPRENGTRFRN